MAHIASSVDARPHRNLFEKIHRSHLFERTMIAVIVSAGVLVGLETSHELMRDYGTLFHVLDKAILTMFVAELIVGFGRYGREWWRFFREGWNIFDLLIVLVCALPYVIPAESGFHTEYFAVLRLARVLRLLKLAEQLPELQTIINALFNSLPSLFYVFLLLVMYFYIYAVLGTDLFRAHNENFATLATSLLTLFRVVTFDDWAALMKDLSEHVNPLGVAAYFVSFILFGAMIFLNLFIGIITSELAELKEARSRLVLRRRLEEAEDDKTKSSIATELHAAEADLARGLEEMEKIKARLASLRDTLQKDSSQPSTD